MAITVSPSPSESDIPPLEFDVELDLSALEPAIESALKLSLSNKLTKEVDPNSQKPDMDSVLPNRPFFGVEVDSSTTYKGQVLSENIVIAKAYAYDGSLVTHTKARLRRHAFEIDGKQYVSVEAEVSFPRSKRLMEHQGWIYVCDKPLKIEKIIDGNDSTCVVASNVFQVDEL